MDSAALALTAVPLTGCAIAARHPVAGAPTASNAVLAIIATALTVYAILARDRVAGARTVFLAALAIIAVLSARLAKLAQGTTIYARTAYPVALVTHAMSTTYASNMTFPGCSNVWATSQYWRHADGFQPAVGASKGARLQSW
ncbi:hypothetical protein LshimejAT787_0111880 [Lyophyllum shimeji]|uniref:Uncharacterized protein n=1 Tax=Lyophyllum shimeji TaxID=47721 RepID=A0A9P3PF34_LYOSH|nr:hypothetical protein LshimejAT787_0111880 [Lyophyllum shimeji]